MNTVQVNLDERRYSIHIEMNSLSQLSSLIAKNKFGNQLAIISDETVAKLYGQTVVDTLKSSGFTAELYRVPVGEDSKSLEQTQLLYTQLIKSGLKRDGLVLALGGGVVGDLAGFVASTYLRGVPFIQLPTTLLAQVDSSVGGKVGINHRLGKNLIGSFYQPKFVLIDPGVLSTLEKREMWAGMAEVVKYGLIWDHTFFSFLEANLENLIDLKNWKMVLDMLAVCCRIKAAVVEQDEKEGGLRRILNFGHTIGHALEAVTNFEYFRHGEAVIYGMSWAAWASMKYGSVSEKEFERITSFFKRFPLPNLPDFLNLEELVIKTRVDKKLSQRGLNLVLLNSIGKTEIITVQDLSEWTKGWLNHVGR